MTPIDNWMSNIEFNCKVNSANYKTSIITEDRNRNENYSVINENATCSYCNDNHKLNQIANNLLIGKQINTP